jgi:flagellin-specific chaperone FliS
LVIEEGCETATDLRLVYDVAARRFNEALEERDVDLLHRLSRLLERIETAASPAEADEESR